MTLDVLQLLKRVREERAEVLDIQQQITELRLMLLPSGIRYDKDRVQTSPSDQMLEFAAKLDELERKSNRHIAALTDDLIRATDIIQQVETPQYRRLLTLRYLTGNRTSWESIADKMGYSVDHVKGFMHQKAIQEARKVNTL